MILNLGVTDLPYADPEPARKVPKKPGKRPRKAAERRGSLTTGDVAEILEAEYHVMEHFVELHGEDIARHIEGSMQGAIENLLAGAPPGAENDIFGTAMSEIEDAFKNMLSLKELDKIGYPGIPTAAAEKGVSHRFKRPYQRRNPRPSFIDTGLYQSSFKAWVT
jgi:hypothetical protein